MFDRQKYFKQIKNSCLKLETRFDIPEDYVGMVFVSDLFSLGPAIIWAKKNYCHRLDGPAAIFLDETIDDHAIKNGLAYAINGVYYNEKKILESF